MLLRIFGVNIKLPEWVKSSANLYVLADDETVVKIQRRIDGVHFYVKTGRCNKCGLCCKLENCEILRENGLCSFKRGIPFQCLVFTPKNVKGCTERFKEVACCSLERV